MTQILVNKCYGGYSLSDEAIEALGNIDCRYDRTNPEILRIFDEMGSEAFGGDYAKIKKVTLPEETTDWKMFDYDGVETIIYVVDGKIHIA